MTADAILTARTTARLAKVNAKASNATKPSEPARISEITIRDFRGFLGDAVSTIKVGGENLLLYGENGSGKSTIYSALSEIFSERSVRHFDADLSRPTCLTNRFTNLTTTKGRVVLDFAPTNVAAMEWLINGIRPTTHPYYSNMARTSGFLDYRSILQTHFLDYEKAGINLFSLLVEKILRHIELPAEKKTFGDAWAEVLDEREAWRKLPTSVPKNLDGTNDSREWVRIGFEPQTWFDGEDDFEEYDLDEMYSLFLASMLEIISEKVSSFQDQLMQRLSEIQIQANQYLKSFDDFVSLSFDFDVAAHPILPLTPDALQDTSHLTLEEWAKQGELALRVAFRGLTLDHPGVFLNEARLTAIALTLYLAALKVQTPSSANLASVCLLVLDDVLIGLDMAHRLPVLKLLQNEFSRSSGWQVFLFTFDRSWYEIAKQRLPASWRKYEMFAVRIGDYEKPVLKPDDDSLLRALAFLEDGETKAAAVHIRSKFEAVIKLACAEFRIPLPFVQNSDEIKSFVFWDAIKNFEYTYDCSWKEVKDPTGATRHGRFEECKRRLFESSLVEDIEHARTWVMNRLSHEESGDRHRSEIEGALYAVDLLEVRISVALSQQWKASPYLHLVQILNAHVLALPEP